MAVILNRFLRFVYRKKRFFLMAGVSLYAFGGRRKNRKKQVKTNKNRFFLVVMAKTLWTKKRFLFVFIGFYLF
ncbi:MAG: hypothetical protein J6M19_02005, partial [Bacteroidaceae bacterium]|nr:hypothetical protein [Bacteroidaceae bacterium]